MTTAKAMEMIIALMGKPDIETAYDTESTTLFKSDKDQYVIIARQWTEKYAC